MGQELSQSKIASEQRTRRLRYKRHKEQPNWEFTPPDGSDIACDKYTVKSCTTELLQNCKSFPKQRFPEILEHREKKYKAETQSEKEPLLQRLRRQIKEETVADGELAKLLKKQCKTLAKLEKKWQKKCKDKSKKSKSELPEWFQMFLKDTDGIISLGPLYTSHTIHEHTSTELKKLTTKNTRLQIRTQKCKQGELFKVSEKYAIKGGRSWKTNALFRGVSVSTSDTTRVCLTGDFEFQDKKVSFDLMVINKANQKADRKLRGVYCRQTNGEEMITWLVNCDQ